MGLLDENTLRELVRAEVRKAIREELRTGSAAMADYLPVVEAARIAAVAPDTIRIWIGQGRLGRYAAGRELRVKVSELEAFLRSGADGDGALSPEEEARRFLARKTARTRPPRVGE